MFRVRSAGFTLLEMLLVLLIGGALMSISLPRIARAHSERQVLNARDSLIWLGAQARSAAIARGRVVRLEVNPELSRVLVIEGRPGVPGDTLDSMDYTTRFGTLVNTSASGITVVCYGARGFTQRSCGTVNVGSNAVNVDFARDGRSARARIRPLGQVDRQ